jgi:hypothetical protein
MVENRCAKRLISLAKSTPILLSTPASKNISLRPSGKSSVEPRAIPRPMRGALRDRHDLPGAGCDGRLYRQLTSDDAADGEVVWS